MIDINTLTWPLEQLGAAMAAVARANGFAPQALERPIPAAVTPQSLDLRGGELDTWIGATARHLAFEAEAVTLTYGQVGACFSHAGPLLLWLADQEQVKDTPPHFLVTLGARRGQTRVLSPDGNINRVPSMQIQHVFCHQLEARHMAGIDDLLTAANTPPGHRAKAQAAMLRAVLDGEPVRGIWALNLPIGAPVGRWLRQLQLPQVGTALIGVHALQYLLWLLAWWLIGSQALQGRIDGIWLVTWALLLVTLIPFRLLSTWLQGMIAIRLGRWLKQRLLAGALNLAPDDTRHQGIGQLLGRVLEADTLESLALNGGMLGLMALIELIFAIAVLSSGAGGWHHASLLMGWLLAIGGLGWCYIQRRQGWTLARRSITHDLVEHMIGHRTRLAQARRETWHQEEDHSVAGYAGAAQPMDTIMACIHSLAPRGWLVCGLLGLAPAFVSGQVSPTALAISLGGMLLAYQALDKLTIGLGHLADAGIAWGQIAPLFRAAAQPEVEATAAPAMLQPRHPKPGQVLLDAHELVFRYTDRSEPVLRHCNLRIHNGDRLLLQGSSGGGKSTLAAMLSGWRQPESGWLLLHGLDRATLGPEGWRQGVVSAPQFHDNHVLSGSFAFNLLMGHSWPPRTETLREAESLCRDLGLGDLLDRMPAGLFQMLGETGWQLSHGEQSRLFIARALLQRAALIILDESFGALDPETLRQTLTCVHQRAATLLVIAHP